jgi:opacity protein-like surface antigen
MNFRSLCLFVLLLSSCASSTLAQSWPFLKHEVYGGLGAANFLGELGGANQIGTNGLRDLEFSLTRPVINIGYRYKITKTFAVKLGFSQAWISGDDAKTKEPIRQNRNLNFKSPISELSLMVEYYPFTEKIDHMYRMKGVRGKRPRYFSPYLTAGIGGFYFNPKGKLDGTWHKLQPLRTEGQGLAGGPSPYKRISICIPLGIGVKYALSKIWSIGFEMSGRKTFTDYIDDVSTVYYDPAGLATINALSPSLGDPSLGLIPGATSPNADGSSAQRGDSADKDAYLFAIFTVHYRFLKYRMHLPKF